MLVQPHLAVAWLSREPVTQSGLTQTLQHLNAVFVAVAALGTAAVCWRARTTAPRAAVMLLLAVAVAGVNFNVTYAAWIAILLVAAGMLREAIALQAWLLVPTLLAEGSRSIDGGWSEGVVLGLYVPMMLIVLFAFAIGWARMARAELVRARSAPEQALAPQPSPRTAPAP
jgi:hypothetical protein